MRKVFLFSMIGGFLISCFVYVVHDMTDNAQASEGFVTYDELRQYDHDLQTKEGGFFDLWDDSKRQDERIQKNWEYINSVDARLFEIEKKLQSSTKTAEPTISFASTDGHATVSIGGGETQNLSTERVYGSSNLIALGLNGNVADAIIDACMGAKDHTHCVESFVGVSSSESSRFKRCSENNCMGLMKNGKVIPYATVEDKINDRARRYNKFRWNNDTTQKRLTKSRYCTSGCENWVSNFDNGVSILRQTIH